MSNKSHDQENSYSWQNLDKEAREELLNSRSEIINEEDPQKGAQLYKAYAKKIFRKFKAEQFNNRSLGFYLLSPFKGMESDIDSSEIERVRNLAGQLEVQPNKDKRGKIIKELSSLLE